ncbi:MAG: thymidine phosphorylase, partial [Epsilonproteobacteria bacterium]
EEATQKLETVLKNGKALEIFSTMVTKLEGPSDFCKNYENYLEKASIIKPIFAEKSGLIETIDTIALGMSVVGLGGGRLKPNDKIDHSVGLENILGLGEKVDSKTPLMIIHAKNIDSFNEAKKRVLKAIEIGSKAPQIKEIYEIIS